MSNNSVKCSLKHHAHLPMSRLKTDSEALMKSDPSLSKDQAMVKAAQGILSELEGQINGSGSNGIKFSISQPYDLFSSAAEVYRPTPIDVKNKLLTALSKGQAGVVKLGLSALTQSQILEIGEPIFPSLKLFGKAVNSFNVEEAKWHKIASDITEKWIKILPGYKIGDKYFNKKWSHRNIIEQQRLASVMDQMTVSGLDIRESRPVETDTNGIMLKKWDDLKSDYDTLLPDTKTLLDEIEKFHNDVTEQLVESMEGKIQMFEMPEDNKFKLISEMKAKFKPVGGPYFPLMRFGDFWVDSVDGFNMFESEYEQKEFIKKLKESGTKINGAGKNFDNFDKIDGVDIGFVDSVNRLIEDSELSPSEVDSIKDQIFQLYLSTMPEASMRKRFIHRKKTPGWEQDALRSFSKKAFHDGKQLAKLKYAPEMRKILNDVTEIRKVGSLEKSTRKVEMILDIIPQIKDYLGRGGVAYNEVSDKFSNDIVGKYYSEKEIVDEIIKRFNGFTNEDDRDKAIDDYFNDQERLYKGINDFKANPDVGSLATDVTEALNNSYDNMMNSKTNKLTRAINQTVFSYILGFNPASAMVNMFQTPGVALPVAAGRHGFVNSSKELARAYNIFFTHENSDKEFSIESGLENDGERAMFEALSSNGTFDRTRSHDLAGLSEEGIARGTIHRDIMEASTYMFHKAEVANREITALMGYRLEYKRTGDVNKSIEYANKLVADTQLDYSAGNRPDLFHGNAARVFLQFKMYSQGMTYLWGKTFYNSFMSRNIDPDSKAEARNILLCLIGVQTSAAGVLGLPIGGILMGAQMLLSLIDDDDDPKDPEVEIRKGFNAVLGDDLGRILSKGILSESGADFAGRLGMSDLWIREPDRELEGKDEAYYLLKTIIGPSAGLLEKVAIGFKFIGDGDTRRGIETMLPNFLAGAAKSYRAIEEGGATNSSGDMIYETNAYEEALQSLGFRPSGVAERLAQNSAIKNRSDAVAKTRGKLLHIAVRAKLDKDAAGYSDAWEDILEFNKKYLDRKITPSTIAKSLKVRKHNSQESKNGLIVKKKDKQFVDEEKII